MFTVTSSETTLSLLRRVLEQPDAPDLRTPSGKGRGYAVVHAGCTEKVSRQFLPVVRGRWFAKKQREDPTDARSAA